jgi:hypothetical protein
MSAEIDPLSTLETCATAAAELLVSAAAARVLPTASVDLSVLIAFLLFSVATLHREGNNTPSLELGAVRISGSLPPVLRMAVLPDTAKSAKVYNSSQSTPDD